MAPALVAPGVLVALLLLPLQPLLVLLLFPTAMEMETTTPQPALRLHVAAAATSRAQELSPLILKNVMSLW